MQHFTKTALLVLALTTVPAIAAEDGKHGDTQRGTPAAPAIQTDDTVRSQDQQQERGKGAQGKRGGQMGQHPALPGGGTSGRQEVPGTGTTVPK